MYKSDLWVELFDLISSKHLDLTLWWMPSHTDAHPKKLEIAPSWMKEWHAKGNKQADIRADVGAVLWRVPAFKLHLSP